ncbi:MAG TPA: ABC transporter permease [Terracidiphilus sp.]
MTRFINKLGLLFGRKRYRNELDEEMAFHREQTEMELVEHGIEPEAARYAAMRRFGNSTRIKERSQEIVGFKLETVVEDLRFALRQFRRNPGFAATAIVILALGMGASVAIFAFVDAALLKPLPYRQPWRLVSVRERGANFSGGPLSYPDYVDWKRTNTVFSSMAAYGGAGYYLSTPSGTEPATGARVGTEFFRTLAIKPALGRDFAPNEELPGASPVVMLSYGAWTRRYGGRADVVGKAVTLSGVAYTVIGVLPREFQFAPQDNAEFWTPLVPMRECDQRRSCHDLSALARLKDGATVAGAQDQIETIAAQLERRYPDSNRGQGASVIFLSEAIVGEIRPILLVLLGGAGLLLLIACVNVASLLLVRSESRRREFAVRGALGASRARLARQFATEGVALVVAGAAVGLALASGGMRLLSGMISKEMNGMPYLRDLGLNAHVLLFAGLLAATAAMLFSLTPMLNLSLSKMSEGLAEGSRGSAGTLWRRLGANLVVIELATAVVLLTGAGLLGRSLYGLLHVDLGFAAEHLAIIHVGLPERAFSKDEQVVGFERQLLERVKNLPGVESAALTSLPPVSCNCNTDWVRFVGKPYNGVHNEVNSRDVTAGFFTTIQTRLVSGRFFTDGEDGTKPLVIVVNEAFARKYFPGEDPIGKIVGDTVLTPKTLRRIVGVVADFKDEGLDDPHWPAEYTAFEQSTDTDFSLMVRTKQDPASILPLLGSTVHGVSLLAGVEEGTSLDERINDSYTAYIHRSTAWLVGGFAALALLLGVVGLYGVIAYSVSQRTREIGVRMALGAQRSSVYSLVLGEAARLIAAGIVLGLASAVGAARLMSTLLFGVQAWDLKTLTAVALLLAGSALLASYFPARRAASVNPTEALRAE